MTGQLYANTQRYQRVILRYSQPLPVAFVTIGLVVLKRNHCCELAPDPAPTHCGALSDNVVAEPQFDSTVGIELHLLQVNQFAGQT